MGEVAASVGVVVAFVVNALVLGRWALRGLGRLGAQRGYPGPAVPALVATVCVVEAVIGPRILAGDQWSIRPVHIAVVGVLMDTTMLVGVLAVLALPRRQSRRGGRRNPRIPFRWLGRLLAVAALATIPVGQRLGMTQGMGHVAWLLGGLAVACHRAGDRARQPTADELQAHDQRPPVVVLRPFTQDHETFVLLSRPPRTSLRRRLTASLYRDMPFVDPDEDRKVTFEAFVTEEVQRALGPLVALGDPRDYLPPLGAARLYADDTEWQRHAGALIDRARCLLTVVCKPSECLTWELDYVVRTSACDRLFVATSPMGVDSKVCSAFASALKGLGYTVTTGPWAPGAVLGFDRSGRMHELATGGCSPQQLIEPIALQLLRHQWP